MAIDSETKRRAAFSAGIPFIVMMPVADGSIDSADRQMLADVYPGIAAGAPVTTGDVIFGMTKIIRTIRTILEPYGSMYEV
jgi:hypothetical protein